METTVINATEYRNASLSLLSESKTNPRRIFEDAALKELSESIRTQGVLSPLLVRPLTENGFEIVAGARRYRAAQMAEADTVPINVSSTAYNSSSPSTVGITTTLGSTYIVVAIGGFHNLNTFSAVSGFTLIAQNNGADAGAIASGPASTAGSYSPGFNVTAGGADNSPVVAVAFETGVLTPDVDTTNWIKM
jgi:ParB-like nuclease domain